MRQIIFILFIFFALSGTGILSAGAAEQADTKKSAAPTYPITFSPVGQTSPEIQVEPNTVTIIGRFYISQNQAEQNRLLELQADSAVVFLLDKQIQGGSSLGEIFAGGAVKAIYLCGDVVMTEGQRTVRADEMYYDFQAKKALAKNTEMRTFDETGNIPIYIRAKELRQLAENKFTASDVTLTTSEFYTPQIAFKASEIDVEDTASTSQNGSGGGSVYDAKMQAVRLQFYDKTIFYLPVVRSSSQRPDVPLKSLHIGNDNTNGNYVESRWYLARILGLHEPQGTDSTLMLDYYDERGPAGGITTKYETSNYFGRMIGYMVKDNGEDWLGRQRKNLEPPNDLRGRFSWRHRQFLPDGWQLTAEVSYLSDENFLESYYRSEYYLDKEQETLLYLKRLEDNRAFSILGKARINDFTNQLDEMPSTEFHWTGQSFFDDRLTFYNDTQLSRFKRRYADDSTERGSQEFFTFTSSRNEIDLPLSIGSAKVVPFTAFTGAYEDGMGFYRRLDGRTDTPEDEVWSAEGGVRLSFSPYWKVLPNVDSSLWDLNQLRHIVRPYMSAAGYTQSDAVLEQRDMVNFGITQQMQTRRGPADNQRTVDWMRLDTSFTLVSDADNDSPGTDRYIWSNPYIPLINELSTTAIPKDRRGSSTYGARNNSFTADYIWHISDTTALLSDINYDLYDNKVQQYDIGFSRMRWPNLSYYLGNRYLRYVDNGIEVKASNVLTFAATYILDPRYTLVYAAQYDLDDNAAVRNDITLIRKYHRLFWAITYSTDASLEQQSVTFSLWPQGVPDLAIGAGRYMQLGGSAGF
jgi:hypothetical protein